MENPIMPSDKRRHLCQFVTQAPVPAATPTKDPAPSTASPGFPEAGRCHSGLLRAPTALLLSAGTGFSAVGRGLVPEPEV